MSEQKWTPEPWYRAIDKDWTMQGVGADRDGRPCTILQGNHNFDDCDANEDRSIVCVNALAGIPDPAAYIARAKRIEHHAKRYLFHKDKAIVEGMNLGGSRLHTDGTANALHELKLAIDMTGAPQ